MTAREREALKTALDAVARKDARIHELVEANADLLERAERAKRIVRDECARRRELRARNRELREQNESLQRDLTAARKEVVAKKRTMHNRDLNYRKSRDSLKAKLLEAEREIWRLKRRVTALRGVHTRLKRAA